MEFSSNDESSEENGKEEILPVSDELSLNVYTLDNVVKISCRPTTTVKQLKDQVMTSSKWNFISCF
jgi:hypothetical protein